ETRDHCAAEALGLVRLQHRGRDPVEIEPGVVDLAEVQESSLKILPLLRVVGDEEGEVLEQRGTGIVAGLGAVAAKAQRQYDAAACGSEVQFGGECHVAVGRLRIERSELL